MASDKEETEPRYYGMELGLVADDVDPEGLGRVRITVPGIIDQPGPWAPVIGTLSGGGPQRGWFDVPPKGSDVAVFFHRGNPERPYVLGGHYGKPAAGPEVPADVGEADSADRNKVHAYETKNWKMTFDDRENEGKLRLTHKVLNLSIDLDAKKGVVEILGESAINIKSTGLVSVDGSQVQIAGRTVMKNGKPIS